MLAKISQKCYIKRLRKKFGKNILYGPYFGYKQSTEHKCLSCRKKFLAAPEMMLRKKQAICTLCFYKYRGIAKITDEKDIKERLFYKFNNKISMINYRAVNLTAKYKCNICNYSWSAKPAVTLATIFGCPACAKINKEKSKPISHKEFVIKLKNLHPNIKLLSKYTGLFKSIIFKCSMCNSETTEEIAHNLVQRTYGCPNCKKPKKITYLGGRFPLKNINLNGQKVKVRGFEPQAIKYLIRHKKIDPNKIKVSISHKIPPINYKYNGKIHNYFPDIQVDNTLIEVKSSYTLLYDLDRNKIKAKACIAKGFKFKFIVPDKDNKTIILPKNWYTWKQKDIENYLRRRWFKKIRVLAIDPGTTNCAWAVIEVNKTTIKILASGQIIDTIKKIHENVFINKEVDNFYTEVFSIMEEYLVDTIIFERFMARGLKGTTIELVNIMLGIISGIIISRNIHWKHRLRAITPAEWKNSWNKSGNLLHFYKKVECSPHQVDAIGIGIYGAQTLLGIKPFENFNESELVKQINSNNFAKAIIRIKKG